MKKKTIQKSLRATFDKFCESIQDNSVRELVAKNSIITGGCIASMLENEKPNDYDIYFADQKTAIAAGEYFVKQFNEKYKREAKLIVGEIEGANFRRDADRVWVYLKSVGVAGEPQPGMAGEQLDDTGEEEPEITDEEKPDYAPVFLSPNAISLSGRIQLIIRFYGDPDTLHENYDFAHCTNYWVSKTSELVLRPEAVLALLTHELVYIGSKYPVCSIIRTRKFLKRGFSITAGTYLKMILQCNELNLFDLNVLEDQLVGVDSAYFMQIIEQVRAEDPEKLNASYLCEIIDQIF